MERRLFRSILKSDKPPSSLPRDFKRFSRPVLWSANSLGSRALPQLRVGGPGPRCLPPSAETPQFRDRHPYGVFHRSPGLDSEFLDSWILGFPDSWITDLFCERSRPCEVEPIAGWAGTLPSMTLFKSAKFGDSTTCVRLDRPLSRRPPHSALTDHARGNFAENEACSTG